MRRILLRLRVVYGEVLTLTQEERFPADGELVSSASPFCAAELIPLRAIPKSDTTKRGRESSSASTLEYKRPGLLSSPSHSEPLQLSQHFRSFGALASFTRCRHVGPLTAAQRAP